MCTTHTRNHSLARTHSLLPLQGAVPVNKNVPVFLNICRRPHHHAHSHTARTNHSVCIPHTYTHTIHTSLLPLQGAVPINKNVPVFLVMAAGPTATLSMHTERDTYPFTFQDWYVFFSHSHFVSVRASVCVSSPAHVGCVRVCS